MPTEILDPADVVRSLWLDAGLDPSALSRQSQEGGSWHVRLALSHTARWLRSLGRVSVGQPAQAPRPDDRLEVTESGWGRLAALPHAAHLACTPARWDRPSVRPGTHPPRWLSD